MQLHCWTCGSCHVIAVCLLSQSVSAQHSQEEKVHKPLRSSYIFPCLIIIPISCYFDCRIDKVFTHSCCMICVVCSVHVISTYYARKGSLYFYLNYPQINESRKSDPRWQLILRVPHKMNPNYRSRRVELKKKNCLN